MVRDRSVNIFRKSNVVRHLLPAAPSPTFSPFPIETPAIKIESEVIDGRRDGYLPLTGVDPAHDALLVGEAGAKAAPLDKVKTGSRYYGACRGTWRPTCRLCSMPIQL